MSTKSDHAAYSGTPGDWVEVRSPRDHSLWRGEILEVLDSGAHFRYRVRWNEEYESLLLPTDCVIVHRSYHHAA